MVEAPFFDFDSLEADQLVDDGDTIGDGWELTFVPGHAPGQLVLAVDDVLFTADHLLSRITPAQGPASRQPGMGLDNYLRSLRKIRPTSGGMLGLGGHEEPIHDIPARIDETITHHEERLRIIHELCLTEERTGADICRHLFGEFEAQGLILALSETLAHIEYLYLIGVLDITNSEAPGDVFDDVLYYVAREGTEPDDIDLFAKQG
jgi:glyoxylase-like metal-dependent hydrolase (beta-lactamase superfamily II)